LQIGNDRSVLQTYTQLTKALTTPRGVNLEQSFAKGKMAANYFISRGQYAPFISYSYPLKKILNLHFIKAPLRPVPERSRRVEGRRRFQPPEC
jgi:hypothetical protein